MSKAFRTEHDMLGERLVPMEAYWGIHTLRAVENFPISRQTVADAPELINSLACIKQAAALANRDLNQLEREKSDAIVSACRQIREGAFHEAFIVDQIQGGAGTSTNMNANEVIANVALELLGFEKGDYARLHPNEDVNMGQSTNDVYPTALKLAAWFGVNRLIEAMSALRKAFEEKAVTFESVVKMGRTQLQDAVPMTLGQEFGAFATMLEEDELRLEEAVGLICEINLGATAIGTGITAHPEYASRVRDHLAELTGVPVVTASNLVEATQDCGAFVQLSGVLKRVAVKLSKTCNDLRLLSSGPRTGLNEINLPMRQAGSSIMPGKVNPVIPEVVNQVAFEVMGNDVTISMAAEAGQLQLNAFEPVIFHSLNRSISHLTAACRTLEENCVRGISCNSECLRLSVENSIGLVTALNPVIGYRKATEIALEAHASGGRIYDLVLEKGYLSEDELEALLEPEKLTTPGGNDSGIGREKRRDRSRT
ncbi:MAG: aspartate ammonia-lyase [Roseibium sp.]|uniref:aspartate ammonia-lyase n=1 Tax=Roseibium sp. TaxID=1936156 RepID=UPI0026027000|nr:aspartate ammonia-lyase [Roseibium sp.]MCV0426617.1 aspartate ammonia-lyase [Roseibium sp.]